jgi:hypothetical protein
MTKGISIINIIIIIGLILLAYLGYTQYLDTKVKQELNNINKQSEPAKPEISESSAQPAKPEISESSAQTATPKNDQAMVKKTATESATEIKPEATPLTEAKKGYYRNDTYFYELSFPENWPIKIRTPEDVSFGTVPPRDGQGAITIEVTKGESNELNQAKAEAKKYAGIVTITEEPIILAGISANKIILNNLLAKTKTVNILIEKSGLNFIIKYSEESPEFVDQVNLSLATFKFYK